MKPVIIIINKCGDCPHFWTNGWECDRECRCKLNDAYVWGDMFPPEDCPLRARDANGDGYNY